MSSLAKGDVSFKAEDVSSTPHAFLLNALHKANSCSMHVFMDESTDINILPSLGYRTYKYGLGEVQTVHLEHEPYHPPSTFQMKALSSLKEAWKWLKVK